MAAIDSHVFTKRMLLVFLVLGVSVLYEGHALPVKHRSDDLTSDAGSSLQDASVADLSQCPPGLWCKRSSELVDAPNHDEKDEGEDLKKSDGEGVIIGCLPGANCKKTQTINTEIETSRACPFGLWCRENDAEDGMKQDDSYPATQSDDDDQCPPGLWCKRNGHTVHPENPPRETTDLTTRSAHCPWELWCSNKPSSGLYDSSVIPQCPPGLWCRRSIAVHRRNCMLSPNNPWCKMRAYMDAAAMAKRRETKRRETARDPQQCPPGLWCKR